MTGPTPPAVAALDARLRAFASALTADDEAAAGCLPLRTTPQGGPARFAIYRHAYRARLTGALRENYPVLHRLLGDEAFDALAHAFIARHPSRQPSIRWFGDALPAYLDARAATDDASSALPHPALPDLARMEWALGTAFDAADAPPLTVAQLLATAPSAWPAMRLTPHPSLRLTPLEWAVEPLWRALSEDAEAETAPPVRRRHHLLSWRVDQQTQWRSAEALEVELLEVVAAGGSFADICQRASALQGDEAAAATAAGHLRHWAESGLLAA